MARTLQPPARGAAVNAGAPVAILTVVFPGFATNHGQSSPLDGLLLRCSQHPSKVLRGTVTPAHAALG